MDTERSRPVERTVGWLRAVAACAVIALAGGGAGAAVDQQQPAVDLAAPGFRVGGVTDQVLAQTVTQGLSGSLSAVRLPVSCTSGSLTLQIQSVAGSVPSGVVLASQSVSGAALPPVFPEAEFRTFFLPVGISLFAGERFAIVLRATGSCEVAAGPLGNPYPRGDAFFRDGASPTGAWSALGARADLPFQTVVDLPGEPGRVEDDGVTGFVSVRCFLGALGL